MNSETNCQRCKTVTAYFIGIGGALLVMGGLMALVNSYVHPGVVDPSVRGKERAEALKKTREVDNDALNNYAEIDKARGIWRLPVTNAMHLSLQLWQNPAAARSNLFQRVDKATSTLPKAPEAPSKFE
jgi:hypothetical protein